jgi:hypothetical protein
LAWERKISFSFPKPKSPAYKSAYMTMRIESITIPEFVCTSFEVASLLRNGAKVYVRSAEFPIEKIVFEFEDQKLAEAFENAVQRGTAEIVIDEDVSLQAAPVDLRNEYLETKAKRDHAKLEELLSVLWEEYGIDPDSKRPRETSGIVRLAIMHDDGVHAYGFKGQEKKLREWMTANGFPDEDWNLIMVE